MTPGRGVWGPRLPFGPERARPTLGDTLEVPASSPVFWGLGGGGGGSGRHCSAFSGFSLVGGSSVTERQGGARPTACGTERSGLGNASFPPPLGSQPLCKPFSGLAFLAPPGGSPWSFWGTRIRDALQSVTASETDVLQRHVVDGGRARVPWCLDRSGKGWEAAGEGAEGEELLRCLPGAAPPVRACPG